MVAEAEAGAVVVVVELADAEVLETGAALSVESEATSVVVEGGNTGLGSSTSPSFCAASTFCFLNNNAASSSCAMISNLSASKSHLNFVVNVFALSRICVAKRFIWLSMNSLTVMFKSMCSLSSSDTSGDFLLRAVGCIAFTEAV